MPREPALAAQDGYAAEQRYVRRTQEVGREVNAISEQIQKQHQDQFRAAMAVNLLSPGYAFQYTLEALLGAGIQHVGHFRRAASDLPYKRSMGAFFVPVPPRGGRIG